MEGTRMTHRSSWWSHIVAALSSTIVSQTLAAIAQVSIIRALGSSEYGVYTTLYAWLAIAGSIIGAGFDTWLLDYGSRHSAQLRHQMARILRIKISIWVGVVIIFAGYIDQMALPLLSLGLLVILLESISATLLQGLRALNRHRAVASIQLIAPSILLLVVSIWSPSQILWLLVIQAVSYGIILTVAQGLLPRVSTTAPTNLITSWPFIVSDILAQIYTYTTTILLASYALPSDVGIFRGAWSFIAYTVVIPAMIFSTTLPVLNQSTYEQQSIIIRRSAYAFALYAISVSGFVAVGGGQVIVWLYGESFAPSVTFIAQLLVLPFIKGGIFFGVMLLIHRQRLVWRIFVQMTTVVILWASMPPLIAQTGIHGAIQAQLITEGILACGYLVGGLWQVRRHRLAPAVWPPRTVVLTNMHGIRNLGDYAIHQQQLAWLVHQFPTASIHRCYALPPDTQSTPGISHWVYDAHGHIATRATRLRRTCALIWSICMRYIGIHSTWGMHPSEQHALMRLLHADLICASGGGYLYNQPSRRPWWQFISWDWWVCADMLVAVIWCRPLVLLPQSIGPIHHSPMRILLTWILKRAHIVYVRESQSAQLLQQLGIVHHRAPDFVWGIPTPTPLPATAIHPTLGITVMDYGQQTGQAQHQHSYETCIIAVARHFHAAGWSIHLFAQCTDDAPGWDDRVVVQRLASHLPFAHIMPVAPSPHVLQQQYAELSCLLSTRLHGALMRFAMNQPAVVIAYHPKAHGIMHDIGLEAWCLAIDTLTPEAVIHAVDTAATQLPIIAAQRQQQVDTLHTLTIPPTAPAG